MIQLLDWLNGKIWNVNASWKKFLDLFNFKQDGEERERVKTYEFSWTFNSSKWTLISCALAFNNLPNYRVYKLNSMWFNDYGGYIGIQDTLLKYICNWRTYSTSVSVDRRFSFRERFCSWNWADSRITCSNLSYEHNIEQKNECGCYMYLLKN